jgi:predicted GTPase
MHLEEMVMRSQFQSLANYLRAIIGALQIETSSQLTKDILTICHYLENPVFRIAVFAPFNYGKSTLLNALLGQRTLPIDLIPTTGAAICVRYGEELSSRITLKNGEQINEIGTNLLKRYALLDEQRCMRDDVAAVDVYCNSPFLKTGVEFLDLPGTNDREAQDELVRDRLLTADLIVQVLDARKLMTLGEREQLRDWLQERGINSVVFVINFLNLLEPEERKEIRDRLRFVAESFRSDLPPGVSNLYCVDALPALRAMLKGDLTAAQTTGLTIFESALQTIVSYQKENVQVRFSRIQVIVERLEQLAKIKKQEIASEITAIAQKQQTKIEIKQKAEKLIKQGFQKSLSDFQSWLYLPKLLSRYQEELALAIQQNGFDLWFQKDFQTTIFNYQQQLHEWVNKGCDFFSKQRPERFSLIFPQRPVLEEKESDRDKTTEKSYKPLDWLFEHPMSDRILENTNSLFQKAKEKILNKEISTNNPEPINRIDFYNLAAKQYLTEFSERAFVCLRDYEESINYIFNFKIEDDLSSIKQKQSQIQLIDGLFESIYQGIEAIENENLDRDTYW